MAKQSDHTNLESKLQLRRYFLDKYHADGSANVMDCCQGEGTIWNHLRREFSCGDYWGMDIKRKKGRLRIDSRRVLSQRGWLQNVIDIDTYGSPWKHWEAMLPNVVQKITVFLTLGQMRCSYDPLILKALRLDSLDVPPAIASRLNSMSIRYCLARAEKYCTIVESVEAPPGRNARYIGVRLQPHPSRLSVDFGNGKQEVSDPATHSLVKGQRACPTKR